MRLTEITKDAFVATLKDPFMGRVIAGVERVMYKLSNDWKLITAPTYDDPINDIEQKTFPSDDDIIVFKVRSAWEKGIPSKKVEADVWNAADAIEQVFASGSTDDDQDWGKNGEEIRIITVYVFEEDHITK